MGANRTFNAMLNDLLPDSLFREEMVKRDYVLNKVEKRDDWKGGKYIVPFKGAGASSISFGSLTSSSDVAQSTFVRGSVDDYIQVFGTLMFNSRDLQEHNGRVNEDSFIKILPDEIESFMQYMKEAVSVQLTAGPNFATVTDSTNAATGIFIVDKIDRFQIGQKVSIDDDNSSPADAYVIAVNVNTKAVTLSTSRGGSAGDYSAYTLAQNAKFYHPGVTGTSDTFTSIKSALLSSANGGSSTIHGVSKLAYPHLQAVNVSGSSITATNILDKLMDAYTEVRSRAKGMANEFLMSYKNLGSVLKAIENQKGQYKVSANTRSASLYGWDSIELNTVKGALTITGIQEMPDDVIPMIDWNSMAFASNGMFQKETSPDGNQFYTVRNTTGYVYLVDVKLFGDLIVHTPGTNGIIYGINY